jgi:hypothetical protein
MRMMDSLPELDAVLSKARLGSEIGARGSDLRPERPRGEKATPGRARWVKHAQASKPRCAESIWAAMHGIRAFRRKAPLA